MNSIQEFVSAGVQTSDILDSDLMGMLQEVEALETQHKRKESKFKIQKKTELKTESYSNEKEVLTSYRQFYSYLKEIYL